jgi:hypothetical protein
LFDEEEAIIVGYTQLLVKGGIRMGRRRAHRHAIHNSDWGHHSYVRTMCEHIGDGWPVGLRMGGRHKEAGRHEAERQADRKAGGQESRKAGRQEDRKAGSHMEGRRARIITGQR